MRNIFSHPQQDLSKSKPNRFKTKGKHTIQRYDTNALSTTRKIHMDNKHNFPKRNCSHNNAKLIRSYISYLIYPAYCNKDRRQAK